MNITIIGCGHGGCALAAHLSLKKEKVTLYADTTHPGYLKQISNNTITLTGKLQGQATIHKLSNNLEEALADAEVIYLALPTGAHLSQFKKILPFLKKGQMVLTLAGNFSSLYFYQELYQVGKEEEITVADIASLPYACRMQANATVSVLAVKQSMDIAAMPAAKTQAVINKISAHFPTQLTASQHLIELGLNITSAISHPTIMLMNAGRIGQQQEDFYFYKEGITPEIALIIEKLDQERIQIGRNYDLRLPSYLDSMNRFYDSQFTSYYDFFTQSKVHNQEKLCPSSINERYLLQDVPALLVPWYSLGEQAGYQASTMRSIIDLASLLNNKQHFQEGRDLSRDLFPSLSIKQTIDFVKTGIVHDNSYYLGAA